MKSRYYLPTTRMLWCGIPNLKYKTEDLNYNLKENIDSKLDVLLRSRWERAQNAGAFRYKLNIQSSKVLPGRFHFLTQLNEDRATKRRKPQVIQQIGTPFNPELFNFTCLKENEILFQVSSEQDANIEGSCNFVAINASPLEYGNCLLLPALEECHPQTVREDGLKFALEFLLLSGSLDLRVGFNGLCAFASVNHQHYHAYYLCKRMLLEKIAVHHVSGPCYELLDFPAEGFVFQLHEKEIDNLIRHVFKLTSFLQEHNIAHNIYMTRGWAFEESNNPQCLKATEYTVRVYVWARIPSHGAKEVDAFNPALCELFGHLPLKNLESYNTITEEFVSEVLHDICHDVYLSVRDEVRKLFEVPE